MRELLKTFAPGVDRHLKNLRAACGNRLCHNSQFMRCIPGSRPGVCAGRELVLLRGLFCHGLHPRRLSVYAA